MGCGCTESTTPDCTDELTDEVTCPSIICDERLLSLKQVSGIRPIGVRCDPAGRCLVTLKPTAEQADEAHLAFGCNRLLSLGSDGCMTVGEQAIYLPLTEENDQTNFLANAMVVASGGGIFSAPGCRSLYYVKGESGEGNRVWMWDDDNSKWKLITQHAVMCFDWTSYKNTNNLHLLGVEEVGSEKCIEILDQAGPAMIMYDSNRKALAKALGKGCLWSDGTDLYYLDYTGKAGQVVRVNGTATGMELGVAGAGGISILGSKTVAAASIAFPAGASYVDTGNALTGLAVTVGQLIHIRWRALATSPHAYMKAVQCGGTATVTINWQEDNIHEDYPTPSERVTICGETIFTITGNGTLDVCLEFTSGPLHPSPLNASMVGFVQYSTLVMKLA